MTVEERRSALRIALVKAAAAIIADRGLQGIKARELATAAGCALGAIYQVFPDLDALITAANETTLAEIEVHLSSSPSDEAASFTRSTDSPELIRLVALALGYLDFAEENTTRWRALFEHRMPKGAVVPEHYTDRLSRLFRFVEEPLADLRPDLADADRSTLARSMFSAVHGMVSLGLEEKLVSLPRDQLRGQIGHIVTAMARGLSLAGPEQDTSLGNTGQRP